MKKSISIWSFYGDWDLKQKLQLAKDAGFEGFEIDVSGDGPINLETTEEELDQIADLANEVGITLSGLATGMYWEFNQASETLETQSKARQVLAKQIHAASHLKIDTILVVPGSVGADFIPGCEEIRYDKVWERGTAFIQQAIPLAEELGVNIGI